MEDLREGSGRHEPMILLILVHQAPWFVQLLFQGQRLPEQVVHVSISHIIALKFKFIDLC